MANGVVDDVAVVVDDADGDAGEDDEAYCAVCWISSCQMVEDSFVCHDHCEIFETWEIDR